MAAHAKGADPRLTEAEMDEYLATPAGGISQPYLVQLETGRRRSADIVVYARLAKRLAVQVEHLITPDE